VITLQLISRAKLLAAADRNPASNGLIRSSTNCDSACRLLAIALGGPFFFLGGGLWAWWEGGFPGLSGQCRARRQTRPELSGDVMQGLRRETARRSTDLLSPDLQRSTTLEP